MVEYVQFRKEHMMLEYEQMRKTKLYNDQEISKIMKYREDFEYAIAKPKKLVKDFCEYIKYERLLLNAIAERRNNRKIFHQKKTIEQSIINRMRGLYKTGMQRFPEETRFYDCYLKFLRFAKCLSDSSAVIEMMLKFHGSKPESWLKAVMWEYNENHNMERVKHILLRGIQNHPECSELYLKFISIILMEADKMKDPIEQEPSLRQANLLYTNAKKKILQVEFIIDVLTEAQRYEFATELQQSTIKDLIEIFPREELTWHTIAQRQLQGLTIVDMKTGALLSEPYHLSNQTSSGNGTADSQRKETLPLQINYKQRIENCLLVYINGVKELNTKQMWSLYINAMIDLNQNDTITIDSAIKLKALSNALSAAHESGQMSEIHYLQYIEMLIITKAEEKHIVEVLEKSTNYLPDSVKLWDSWIRYYILQNNDEKVYSTFRRASKKLIAKSLPLWHLIIQYFQTRPDLGSKVEEIYKEALNQGPVISTNIKPKYIEWIALTKGMEAARKMYGELALQQPLIMELHDKMQSLESMQMKPNIRAWRYSHQLATQLFGSKRTDVWINYIKFERDRGDVKNMNLIFEQAKSMLNTSLADNFISDYSLLTLGIA